MREKSEIAYRNRNHTGWWIFTEVEYWVSDRQRRLKPSSRCPVYENTRLLRAKSREEAYRKATELGGAGRPSRTNAGEWRFAGISMLLPVYDKIEDGAEILWDDRRRIPLSRIKKMVKGKNQLSVFDDTEKA